MSIPLIQKPEKDDINTSIIAIKRNIERINMLLGLSNSEEIDTSMFATKDELQQAVTDLQPVDEVAVDNMHSVTSNAVAQAIKGMAVDSEGTCDNGNGYYIKFQNGLMFVTSIFSYGNAPMTANGSLYSFSSTVNLPIALKSGTKPLFFDSHVNSKYGSTPNIWFCGDNYGNTSNTKFYIMAYATYQYNLRNAEVNYSYIGWWK